MRTLILSWSLVSILSLVAIGAEQPAKQEQGRAAASELKIPMAQALDIAAKKVKGTPYEAELTVEKSQPVYEVFLLAGKRFMAVAVDGTTGRVLAAEQDEVPQDPQAARERQEIPKVLAASKITFAQAFEAASREAKGGQVVAASVQMEKGRPVYEIHMVPAGSRGNLMAYRVDAANGKLLMASQAMPIVASWSFDNDPVGKPPRGWMIRQTNPSKTTASWAVMADETAPSQPNALCLTKTENTGSTYNLALAEKTSFEDLDMTVQVKSNTGKEDQGGGLVWRAQDENNYYVCRMNPLEPNFRVYKVVAGKRTQLGTAKVETKTGAWHTVRAVMMGDHITCYLDGDKLLDVRDTTFAGPGMIGLWTKADAASCFDDLVVAQPTTQPARPQEQPAAAAPQPVVKPKRGSR